MTPAAIWLVAVVLAGAALLDRRAAERPKWLRTTIAAVALAIIVLPPVLLLVWLVFFAGD